MNQKEKEELIGQLAEIQSKLIISKQNIDQCIDEIRNLVKLIIT